MTDWREVQRQVATAIQSVDAVKAQLVKPGAATGDAGNMARGAPTLYSCSGYWSEFKSMERDNWSIQTDDRVLAVAAGSLSVVPEVGDKVRTDADGDMGIVAIRAISPGEVPALWRLQVRR